MNYLKLGPVRIPYKVITDGEEKTFQIMRLKIPFSTIIRDNRKYYRMFGLTFRIPFLDKYLDKFFINQAKLNF